MGHHQCLLISKVLRHEQGHQQGDHLQLLHELRAVSPQDCFHLHLPVQGQGIWVSCGLKRLCHITSW